MWLLVGHAGFALSISFVHPYRDVTFNRLEQLLFCLHIWICAILTNNLPPVFNDSVRVAIILLFVFPTCVLICFILHEQLFGMFRRFQLLKDKKRSNQHEEEIKANVGEDFSSCNNNKSFVSEDCSLPSAAVISLELASPRHS
jgi:ABC-type multidrug transport system fused ATPase/permease subunit